MNSTRISQGTWDHLKMLMFLSVLDSEQQLSTTFQDLLISINSKKCTNLVATPISQRVLTL